MSNYKTENDFILQAIAWTANSCRAILQAGGDPVHILRNMPDDLLSILVRNKIGFKYYGPAE